MTQRRPLSAWRLAAFQRLLSVALAGVLWLGLAGLAGFAGVAHAHSSSNSYLQLTQREGAAVLRVDMNLRDIDLVFDLDIDQDTRVLWSETLARRNDILAWMQQGIRVQQGGEDCALQAPDFLVSEHADGLYLSTEWALACPVGTPLEKTDWQLRYQLLFDQDNLHRGLLRVNLGALQSSAMFSPEQPVVRIASEGGAAPATSVLWRYLVDGVWHIWIGLDHILFLLSLLLLAPLERRRAGASHHSQNHHHNRASPWQVRTRLADTTREVVLVVTAFTVAHSITLGLSVLQVVEPSARVVESVIALSVVLAAANNLLGRAALRRWPLALVFGLIHGFGFAFVLVDLGLPARDLALALGGFNVGVELGQLAIVLVFLPLAWTLRSTRFYQQGVVLGGSWLIALIGLYWLVTRMVATG